MKKLIKLLVIVSMIFLFSYDVFAANATVVTRQNQVITITGLDPAGEDWDASVEAETLGLLRNGVLKVWMVVFIPSATNDRMIIRDDGIDGSEFFDAGKHAEVYDSRVKYYYEPLEVNPVIDVSDCTIATPADVKVMIYILKPKP